ncbi:MAG: hypothetical protein NC453_18725, partial [Muribaculum sp.]|nr:hypothetical protein [Muribaculum sp.]
NTAFEIATLALITDYVSDSEREAVLTRYFDLFDTALSTNNTTELGDLLALAAYWNSNPTLRQRIKQQLEQIIISYSSSLNGLSLPARRVNAIAASVYAQIDKVTGKYDEVSDIPAGTSLS